MAKKQKSSRLKVLFAASEAHPLIKTGGLADVAGSLPAALRELDIDVRLMLPAYPSVMAKVSKSKEIAVFSPSGAPEPVRLLEAVLEKGNVPVYLVDSPTYFHRAGNPYTAPNSENWPDNAERFALFCRAVVHLAMDRAGLKWKPDLVHTHDWQTGLVSPLLSFENERPASLFTIHNLAYQGVFGEPTFHRLNLPASLWSLNGLEFHHNLSFIKGGIAFSDRVNTVSPTYAAEVRTPEYGYGLEGLLSHRGEHFVGVLNGIDYDVWNPSADPLIGQPFSLDNFAARIENKRALQQEYQLPVDDNAQVFGYIGRLVEQKGVDLILQVLPGLLDRGNSQIVMLGTGNPSLEHALNSVHASYPGRIGIYIGYDEGRAHRIEAGCDAFLMPSRFEPCGLNQLYSLRYGAVPIVRHTGGLADTVTDVSVENLSEGRATGFLFHHASAAGLWSAVDRALQLWEQNRDTWSQIARNGMARDFSWGASARHYLELYQQAIAEPISNPVF